MRTAMLFAAALVACASLPLTMAQQVDATTQQNASASAAGMHADESSNANASVNGGRADADAGANGSAESSLRKSDNVRTSESGSAAAEMRPVTGQLESKLDSKTAKPGDQVFLKTTEKTKTADGVVIPKGSRLVGHVTEVQAHAKGQEDSHMGLEFDRMELKNGQTMAIHSMIQSIQPSAAAMAASSMDDEAALNAPISGGGGMVAAGGHAGGSLLGGAGGAVGAVGRAGAGLESAADSTMHAAGDVTGVAAGSVGHSLSTNAQGASSLGAHATGIPGVMLNGDATASASGMLSAANKNIHLDSGTQMVLGVAAVR